MFVTVHVFSIDILSSPAVAMHGDRWKVEQPNLIGVAPIPVEEAEAKTNPVRRSVEMSGAIL
jgi:hypothetical protein